MKYWILVAALSLIGAPACRSNGDTSTGGSFETQTMGSSISFQLTPKLSRDGRLVLELRANTHSGDLSEVNLKQAVQLHIGDQTYRPVEAPSLSGHHDGGSVVFQPKGDTSHFAVTIEGVRGMQTLQFDW